MYDTVGGLELQEFTCRSNHMQSVRQTVKLLVDYLSCNNLEYKWHNISSIYRVYRHMYE